MEYTTEQLKEKFKTLPEDIQGLILDENFGPAVTLLCSEVGVDATKALDVEDEAVAVLMGTSHPKDFIRNIQTKLGVDQEKARAIAEKVNDEIFQPVRESLKKIHNITDEATEAGEAPKIPSAPFEAPHSTLNVPRPPAPPLFSGSTLHAPSSTTKSVFPEVIVPKAPTPTQPAPASPKTSSAEDVRAISPQAGFSPKPQAPEIPKAPQNIFEQKLQGVFKMPKEETLVPPKPGSSAPVPPPAPRAPGIDPYREPAA